MRSYVDHPARRMGKSLYHKAAIQSAISELLDQGKTVVVRVYTAKEACIVVHEIDPVSGLAYVYQEGL